MTIAEEAGIMAFGQASDMSGFGPNAQLTAIIDNWAPYYIERVQAVLDGTWESHRHLGRHRQRHGRAGAVLRAHPEEVRAQAQAAADAIAAGELHPFTGPINRQDGSAWLAEGETADDATLLGMNFYVEGIEGVIPN
jgi:basic membrane protein A and related proteins